MKEETKRKGWKAVAFTLVFTLGIFGGKLTTTLSKEKGETKVDKEVVYTPPQGKAVVLAGDTAKKDSLKK